MIYFDAKLPGLPVEGPTGESSSSLGIHKAHVRRICAGAKLEAAMLDYEEATYRSEDESNVFNFMTIMIIIPYLLYTVLSGV